MTEAAGASAAPTSPDKAAAGIALRLIPGTQRFSGHAGSQHLTVDRSEGYAGGTGAGFRGGQLLGLAIAGCLANSLQESAFEQMVQLVDVDIAVTIAGNADKSRIIAVGLDLQVVGDCDRSTIEALFRGALEVWTVALSIQAALPISFHSITLNGVMRPGFVVGAEQSVDRAS